MAFSPHSPKQTLPVENLETKNVGKRPSRCFEENLSPISTPKMLRLEEGYSDKLRSSPNTSVPSPSILIIGTDRKNKKKHRVSFAKKIRIKRFERFEEPKSPPEIVAPIAESVKLRRRNSIEVAKPAENETGKNIKGKFTDKKRNKKNSDAKKKTPKKPSFSDKVQRKNNIFQTNAKAYAGKSKAEGNKNEPNKPTVSSRLSSQKLEKSSGQEISGSKKRKRRRDALFVKVVRIKRGRKEGKEMQEGAKKFPDWETDDLTALIRKAMKEDYDALKTLLREKDSLDIKKIDKDYVSGNCYQDPEVQKLRFSLSQTINEVSSIDGSFCLRKGSVVRTCPKKGGKNPKLVKRKKLENNLSSKEASTTVLLKETEGLETSADDSALDRLEKSISTDFWEVAEGDCGSEDLESSSINVDATEIETVAENKDDSSGEKESREEEKSPNKDESEKSDPVSSESLPSTAETEGENFGKAISVWDDPAPDRDVEEDDRSTVIFDEREVAAISSNVPKRVGRRKILRKGKKVGKAKTKAESAHRRSVGSGKRGKKIRLIKIKKRRLLKKKEVVPSEKKTEEKADSIENVLPDSKFSEYLKEISGLVKRLHESHQIILFLEKDMASKPELADHYKPVISAQYANYRKYISEHKSAILKGFDEMSAAYEKANDVYLLISKEALLTVEEVSQVLSRCILVEDVTEPRTADSTNGPSCSVPEKTRKESPAKQSVAVEYSRRNEAPRNSGAKAMSSKPVHRVLPTAKVDPVKDVYDFVSSEDDSSAEKRFPRRTPSGGNLSRPNAGDRTAGCQAFLRPKPTTLMANSVPVLTYFVSAPAIPSERYYILNNLQPQQNFVAAANVPGSVVPIAVPQTNVATVVETENRTEKGPVCQKPPMPVLYRVTNNDKEKPKGLTVKIAHDGNVLKFIPVSKTSRYSAPNSFASAPPNPPPVNPPSGSANAEKPSRVSLPLPSTRTESKSVPQRGSASSATDHQYAALLPRNKPGPAKRTAAPKTSPENGGSARTDAARFENFATSRLSVPTSPKPSPNPAGPSETVERNRTTPDPVAETYTTKVLAQLMELSKQLVELRVRRRSDVRESKKGASTSADTPTTSRKETPATYGNTNSVPTKQKPRAKSPTKPSTSSEGKRSISSTPPTRRSPRKKPEEKSSPVVDISRVKIEKSPEENSNGVYSGKSADRSAGLPLTTEKRFPEDKEETETEDGENSTDDEYFLDLDNIKKELEDNHGLIHFICAENKCMKPGMKICTGCESVLYCGRKCQAKHWEKKHHKHCQQLREQAEVRKRAKSTPNNQQD